MAKNKIVVVTPCIRKEGLELVQKALEKQDFENFDWIISSPFNPGNWATWVKDDFKGGLYSLNRSYQSMFKVADCDLVVSWQDFTYADEDCLQRFWDHYEYDQEMIVSAIGHKYKDDTWKEVTWKDPRVPGLCGYGGVEWNLVACPKKAIVDAGGFDEELDNLFYGLGEFQLDHRLSEMGYKFYVDPKIESFSLGHGRVADWDEKNGIDNGTWLPYKKRVVELKNTKRWPVIGKL